MQHKYNPPEALVGPGELNNESFFLPPPGDIINNENLLFAGISAPSNKWIELACDLATESVQKGGGPFGAVILQVDSSTGTALRYWATSNGVTKHADPTAHAEVLAIRSACYSLGVFHLDKIQKQASKLNQSGDLSHCILFSSCEPCPMCYGAASWARIPVLFFGATRYDAAGNMINFADADIYEELIKPYAARKIKSFRCTGHKTTEAFELWKNYPGIHY
jgi:guanine deaminase